MTITRLPASFREGAVIDIFATVVFNGLKYHRIRLISDMLFFDYFLNLCKDIIPYQLFYCYFNLLFDLLSLRGWHDVPKPIECHALVGTVCKDFQHNWLVRCGYNLGYTSMKSSLLEADKYSKPKFSTKSFTSFLDCFPKCPPAAM